MLAEKYAQEIAAVLAKYPPDQRRAAVMPLIYLAQREKMYLERKDMAEIAEILGLNPLKWPQSLVFTAFITINQAESITYKFAQIYPVPSRGAEEFLHQICERLGIAPGETTADGLITVEAVMCLAACDRAPMFQVQSGQGLQYFENQTVERALALIEELRTDAGSPAGE